MDRIALIGVTSTVLSKSVIILMDDVQMTRMIVGEGGVYLHPYITNIKYQGKTYIRLYIRYNVIQKRPFHSCCVTTLYLNCNKRPLHLQGFRTELPFN